MQTQAVEDYLKSIFNLQDQEERVSTTSLAQHLQVAPASVTGMIKKLAAMNLLVYTPYQGVRLTEAGEKIALEVIRHHRLVESYLAEALGVPWDQVHEEADKWEHILSEDLEDRMDEMLGYPTTDPHGSPIPTREGVMPESSAVPLTEIPENTRVTIAEVSDHDPAMLRYLGDMGLAPGSEIRLISIAPFKGPVTIRVEGQEHAIGQEVASHILVELPEKE